MLEVKQAKTSALLNQANMEQKTLIMDIVHIWHVKVATASAIGENQSSAMI